MSHSVEIRVGTIRRTEFRRSSWWTRYKHVWPIAMRTDGKQQNWVVDTWTSQNQKSSSTRKPPRTFEQEMAWAKMATEEGGREREREEEVVVFNDLRPRGLRHGARDVGQTAVERCLSLIGPVGRWLNSGPASQPKKWKYVPWSVSTWWLRRMPFTRSLFSWAERCVEVWLPEKPCLEQRWWWVRRKWGTSSFEDDEHNVDNLALEAFPSTWTGCDFWGEGSVGRNGVTVNSVSSNMVCLLQNEGVPSVPLCASLFCVKFRRSKRRPYHISEALWQQSEGWFSWLSMCARGKETPKLFMVRAFHLLVSVTGTGDGCLLLEPRSFDSKAFENQKTEWLARNDEVWEWKMNTDGETVVILHKVRLKRMCRKLSWCHRFSTLPCVMPRQKSPNLECSETVEILQNAISRKGGQWHCQEKESASLDSHVLWFQKKNTFAHSIVYLKKCFPFVQFLLEKPRASLLNILLLLVYLLLSHLSLIVVCSVVALTRTLAAGQAVSFLFFYLLLFLLSLISLLFFDSVFLFFDCVLCTLLYFLFPPFVLFHLSLFPNLFFPPFSKLSLFKLFFSWSPLAFLFFSEPFLFSTSSSSIYFLNSFVKTCDTFCLSLVPFFVFCVFLSFLSRLFFFCCLHAFCEHRLFRIVFLWVCVFSQFFRLLVLIPFSEK